MTSFENVRRFGDVDVSVRVIATGGRCPACRRYGLDAVYRKMKDKRVQCWGECPSCHASVVGGGLPAGSGDMEVETRILESAQAGRLSWRSRQGASQ